MNELETAAVEPMAAVVVSGQGSGDGKEGVSGQGSVVSEEQHLREDVVVKAEVVGDVLKGAPDPAPPYFRVPKVIDR